jgi:hypothetical protein
MILPISIGVGLMAGAILAFAAQEGRIRDAIGGIVLAVLVAVSMALALALTGCASTGEFYNIPVDFGAYPSTVAPLSGCDGR